MELSRDDPSCGRWRDRQVPVNGLTGWHERFIWTLSPGPQLRSDASEILTTPEWIILSSRTEGPHTSSVSPNYPLTRNLTVFTLWLSRPVRPGRSWLDLLQGAQPPVISFYRFTQFTFSTDTRNFLSLFVLWRKKKKKIVWKVPFFLSIKVISIVSHSSFHKKIKFVVKFSSHRPLRKWFRTQRVRVRFVTGWESTHVLVYKPSLSSKYFIFLRCEPSEKKVWSSFNVQRNLDLKRGPIWVNQVPVLDGE